ncbi:UDP-glucose 4-epimerase GalE [Candidatus Falkowbacteria bacterium RIFOXYB2_FULL_34_18]|uniref:UDP-glucose 4-epimerase n=1 Tax=Candidatus Falkowbacteria bacterium RIFOXYD2_FULL_34_120 TaxID=1798007 RepID=A0A1F5TSA8_9BACT|nr:MAG: UDP-glucose 4-epimerase GalE [Candidatus Falkowbacteria bacterium RIFOXYB2_FULL_34_18]OGF29665.1 MAG: UDP-glucose 4-epimerase GalE [Candidatus Falkowbacteria bacterium RIFOXYC12_FULL_34_55]OGF37392.1 MAG: UDP-glucose 4-epimerase GalE [Candidatus Falkowbacteria bacterium RIFOXYC2_FULL_34_220]OGF39130.1 MAG: UDP-glucose 4-epimerase GalE [Candidatus Falkowbacteria bacterium RIFOXYD12_FULL_34_57]OGF41654.1 MAG: UDP-glucose 4-epimerase GalE [Candidatus Falkowbacteria bacterium RIFOXYD2_FULL_
MSHKILVTGGAGYIGSHTTVELQNAGFEVIIIDNFSNSNPSVLDGIEKITGIRPLLENFDLCDGGKLNKFFEQHADISGIIHFAALKAVEESINNPLKYYRNNLAPLIGLLENMKQRHISNIVFSSSACVYGEPAKLPVTENSPIQKAASPYGETKQIGENIISAAAESDPGLKAVSLRYFNVIGAHDSALIGELPEGIPANLVPFLTQAAAGIRDELKIFGNDYSTPDGTCVRDYIHVVDLAKAHVATINRLLQNKNKKKYEVFNLGSGKGNSVMEVVKSFEKVSDKKLNYKIVDRRPGDIAEIYASADKANTELGWKAEKTLDDAMKSAWNWQKNLVIK